jgi:hypothetical protein
METAMKEITFSLYGKKYTLYLNRTRVNQAPRREKIGGKHRL